MIHDDRIFQSKPLNSPFMETSKSKGCDCAFTKATSNGYGCAWLSGTCVPRCSFSAALVFLLFEDQITLKLKFPRKRDSNIF